MKMQDRRTPGLENRMAALGDVIAELVSRGRSPSSEASGGLQEVRSFGENPGALQMRVHVPRTAGAGAPLVVVLHGCAQTAAGYAQGAGWLALADRFGFVLLCPEQTRSNNANGCFNWFIPTDVARGSGEAASVAAMVRHAIAAYEIDPGRVFVTGLSAGGAMATVMLAAYPEMFAAGGIVAGLPYGAAEDTQAAFAAMRKAPAHSARTWGDKVRKAGPPPARWPRISIWHGDADTTVTTAAADALALQWTELHGVSQDEPAKTASSRHRRTLWRGADGEILVEAHRVAGLGHGTPIAAAGPDGCGAAAPWILEAGVSSSLEMAIAWGIADAVRPSRGVDRPREAIATLTPVEQAPSRTVDVSRVISDALKKAGLLR